MKLTFFRRKVRSVERRFREAQLVAKALKSPGHPILAHIVPIRRCNLACTYCNEFDDFSLPVPTAEMLRRIDRLAALGTTAITLSGGEPLLHPDLEEIIRCIRSHAILAGLITNGYLLTPERIRRLNRAGLDYLQTSIDNMLPDDVSKKSLKVLDQVLQRLAAHAEFAVNVNSVLGSPIRHPEDALAVARRARELGLGSTVGLLHDPCGQLRPLSEEQRRIYDEIEGLSKPFYTSALYNLFQKNLSRGLPADWHCRAGSRYLYVCENGLVHYCSQQRGRPGIPLEQYTREHLEREYNVVKPCAPFCTISCVHRAAMLDDLRQRPLEAIARFFPSRQKQGSRADMPLAVGILLWLFLPSNPRSKRRILRQAALLVLGVK